MKNHREFSGVLANILIVVAILIFIVLGLNKIGVYDLPDAIEKLIGTYNENSDKPYKNYQSEHGLGVSFDGKKSVSDVYELNYLNAVRLLENISPVENYNHKIEFKSFYEEKSLVKNVSLSRKNGLYSAYIIENDNRIVKEISESASTVTITSYMNSDPYEAVFERANFNISDECGFIINVDAFLDSGFELDSATFTQLENEYGTAVKITFADSLGAHSCTESYIISMDYGVVLSAECHEDGLLVYSMSTKELSR